MPFSQFMFMAMVAIVVTVPAVLLIPRARQSRAFDLFLWISTWVIAFLSAWAALGYVGFTPGSPLPADTLAIADTPAVPVILGAAAGALLLNVVLWVMDRLAHPADEMLEEEAPLGDEVLIGEHAIPGDGVSPRDESSAGEPSSDPEKASPREPNSPIASEASPQDNPASPQQQS